MKKRNQSDAMDSKDHQWSFKNIMKDIEFFGASHMTWKERKQIENRKVVSLGGKPPKNQRLPLSVARVQMKKQKEREEKKIQENMILGRFGGKLGIGAKRSTEKRKPEDRVFKTTEGYFKNGVLDVKHMLNPSSSRGNHSPDRMVDGGGKKGKGKKNGGKKKGRGVRNTAKYLQCKRILLIIFTIADKIFNYYFKYAFSFLLSNWVGYLT